MRNLLAATTALAILLIAAPAPAPAQIAPNDSGVGTRRGMQEMNNSGQVGDVTLFDRGSKTLVVIDVKSTGGKPEPAHIHRAKGCDQTISTEPAFPLKDVVGGRSSTLIDVPESRLLSGNYVVLVHSSSAAAMESMHMAGMHMTAAQMSAMPESPRSYFSCGYLYH